MVAAGDDNIAECNVALGGDALTWDNPDTPRLAIPRKSGCFYDDTKPCGSGTAIATEIIRSGGDIASFRHEVR